jgi:ABC-type maltose transport system permease subunit
VVSASTFNGHIYGLQPVANTLGLFYNRDLLAQAGVTLFALTLTTTSDVRPVTLGTYQYLGAYVSKWSSVIAAAVLTSVPAVALLPVAQRFVAASLSDRAGR